MLDSTLNPVRISLLIICGHKSQLIIEELIDHQDEGSVHRTPEDLHWMRSSQNSEMQIVSAQLLMIRK